LPATLKFGDIGQEGYYLYARENKKESQVISSINGKCAVVTGGANGIGRATALRLAGEGADIGLLDLEEEALVSVVAEIEDLGGKALGVATDCTNPDAISNAFSKIRTQLGPVDILINNVGQSSRDKMTDFATSDLSTLDFILDINLKSCILCSRQVITDMCSKTYGKIVNLASESAVNGSPRCWDYGSAKAGVIGFTRTLAQEVAAQGITVNAVGPGAIRTRAYDLLPKDIIEQIVAGIPVGRVGEPEEIADVIAFLSSDQSSYITGQTLLVNGGNWML
jgi:NAD(P)-dependent dehydrogenase (short-subunit alcohol dehydrogenase family)